MDISCNPAMITNTLKRYWQTFHTKVSGIFHHYFYVFICLGLFLSGFASFIKPSLINSISFTLIFSGLFVHILAIFNKTRNFGVVVDAQGKPSAYLAIDLYRWNGHDWDIYTRCTTDAHGRYILAPEDGYYFFRLLSPLNQILSEKRYEINNAFPTIREKLVIS